MSYYYKQRFHKEQYYNKIYSVRKHQGFQNW